MKTLKNILVSILLSFSDECGILVAKNENSVMLSLFKNTILAIGLLFCIPGHAQNSEIYLTVLQSIGKSNAVYTTYDLELSSDNYSRKEHIAVGNLADIYTSIPSGPLHIRITPIGTPGMKPFADSIYVHEGINAVMIEMDCSGEQAIKIKDENNNEIEPPEALLKYLGSTNGKTYTIPKPSRPKILTINGARALSSNVFVYTQGVGNPAFEVMEKNHWATLDRQSGSDGNFLILNDEKVHWSWKKGCFVFWKE